MALNRVADLTWRHPRKVLLALALLVAGAAVLGSGVERHLEAAGFTDPSTESERAAELLRDELGYDAGTGIVVLISDPAGGRLAIGSEAVRDEVARVARRLGRARFMAEVSNPLAQLDRMIARAERAEQRRRAAQQNGLGELPPPPSRRQLVRRLRERNPLIADDGRSLLVTGHLSTHDFENDGGVAARDAERLLAGPSELELGLGGFAVGFKEVEEQTRKDLTRAELIAFPALALLLLVVFRGLIAAAIPLLVGAGSILGTFAALRVMAELTPTSLFALNIATALSLGLAVDYALLMVTRYREELAQNGAGREAHRRTVTTAGRTVLFSGLTVAGALLPLVFFPQRFLYSVGAAGAIVGVLAAVIALFGVSSILAVLGGRIDKLAIRRGRDVASSSGGWYRLAHGVMRRPALVAIVSGGAMLAVAAPALSSELTGPSAEAVPPSQPSHPVQERIDAAYGHDVAEPITVVVHGRLGAVRLRQLSRRIGRIDAIVARNRFQRAGPGVAYASFGAEREALHSSSQDAVRAIRALDLPAGARAELLVTGNTAGFVDLEQSLLDHLPLVAGTSVALTLVLLFLLTGSVILPLKTLVMNLLTLAVVLGILTAGFHDGWLAGPLGYEGPRAIELMTLALVFAIAFGLATDYAVLVMARIKEQHDLGASNREAVAIGIGRTGRVITAAAACLAVVFIAFATSEIFFMKQAAIGQAAAVLLDATIVRALLVPSLMALLGDLNWWAPGPLRRFHARFGLREG